VPLQQIVPLLHAPPSLAAAWQCDLSDSSLRWSRGVYDLFGITPGAKVDRRETVLMYDEESRALLERLRSAAIAERGSFTFEARIQRPDGEWRDMLVSADTWCSNGRVTHLYGTKRDVTAI
jgi:PAS domain S-box-containing protein